MKSKKIDVLIFDVGKNPVEKKIDNTLETLQKCVHGYIECVNLSKDIVMICNEDGKFNGSLPNRKIGNDVIFDTFVICGDTHDGDFRSLTKKEKWLVASHLWDYIDTQNLSDKELAKMREARFELLKWY